MTSDLAHRSPAQAPHEPQRQLLRCTAQQVVRRERSGSSSPVVVETNEGVWFTKLRGAAQGAAPLIAEIIVAELADSLSRAGTFEVPTRALIELPRDVSSLDVNDELRDLLDASVGVNVGFALLEAARNLTRAEFERVPPEIAVATLWLDILVQNIDRTPANPNVMVRRGKYWLIDHGAALPFHYDWQAVHEQSPRQPYDVDAHVFGWSAPLLTTVNTLVAPMMTRDVITRSTDAVPDELLDGDAVSRTRRRAMYAAWLWKRRQWMQEWLSEV